MEGFNKENHRERKEGVSLVLDSERIETVFLGKGVEDAASELIKLFSIITYVKKKGVSTSGEVELLASDLLNEFNVLELKYNMVFTNKVIDQILRSQEIDSVSMEFNGELLIAKSGSTIESVVEAWAKLGFYSQDAIKTRENKREGEKEAVKKEQAIIDIMLTELDTFNFTNQEKVIDWLYEYYIHSIRGADMHKNELLEKFQAHGYVPENNDKVDGMLGKTLKDKERLGRVIIGYLLMNGSLALRNNWLKALIEDWKRF